MNVSLIAYRFLSTPKWYKNLNVAPFWEPRMVERCLDSFPGQDIQFESTWLLLLFNKYV